MALAYDKSKVKILVVDDEDSIRQMLSMALKDEGWDVHEAVNGKEAYESLASVRPHIIVSDINMPEMTGVELLEKVREEYPKIEFLIMTSHATLDSAVKAVSLGAYDYLNKPFEDISVVPKKIEKVADKILLRQQNQELIKRLKSAGNALKRLLERIAPLNSVLEMDKLREIVTKAFPSLFQEDSVRASWWSKDPDSGKWLCQSAIPSKESFEEMESPEDCREKLADAKNLEIHELSYKGEVSDVVVFEAYKPSLGEIFMRQVEMTYEKVHYHMDVASLANKDGLTRLYNHRYFQERLRQEMSQAQRQKSGLSLILMDIDHFKHYNDNNGHPAGDDLLKKFASLLSDQTESSLPEGAGRRVTDIAARYGGEEFVMILPFTFYEGAMIKAERIRKAIESFAFEHAETQPLGKVSVSIGVACFPQHAENAEQLIQFADKALYQAKKDGRNRAVGYDQLRQAEPNEGTKPSDLESEGQPRVEMPKDEEAPITNETKDEDLIAEEEILLGQEEAAPEPEAEQPEDVAEVNEEPVPEVKEEAAPVEEPEASEEVSSDDLQAVDEVQPEQEVDTPQSDSQEDSREEDSQEKTQQIVVDSKTQEISRDDMKSAYDESTPTHTTQETPKPLVEEKEESTVAEEKPEDFLSAYAPDSLPSELKKGEAEAVAAVEKPADPVQESIQQDHDDTPEESIVSNEEQIEEPEEPEEPEEEKTAPEAANDEEVSEKVEEKVSEKTEALDTDAVAEVKKTLGAILEDREEDQTTEPSSSEVQKAKSPDELAEEVKKMANQEEAPDTPKKLGKPPIHNIDVSSLVDAISTAVDGQEGEAFVEKSKGTKE